MDIHPFAPSESRVLIIMTGYVEYFLTQTLFTIARLASEVVNDQFLTLGSLYTLVLYQ